MAEVRVVILYTGKHYQALAYICQITSERGVIRVTWPTWNFEDCSHFSGTAEARVV